MWRRVRIRLTAPVEPLHLAGWKVALLDLLAKHDANIAMPGIPQQNGDQFIEALDRAFHQLKKVARLGYQEPSDFACRVIAG